MAGGSSDHGPATRGRWTRKDVVISVVAVVTVTLLVIVFYQATSPDLADVRTATRNAAYELERTPVKGLGVYNFDVQRALTTGNPGSGGRGRNLAREMVVTDAGQDSRGSLYEINTEDGKHPVCLVVATDVKLDGTPTFPRTQVVDGRCQAGAPSPGSGRAVR